MNCYELLITGPRGLEELLADELRQLGLEVSRATPRGVFGQASRDVFHRIRLWSRLANRIYAVLGKVRQADRDSLYACAAGIPWPELMAGEGRFWIQGQGHYATLKHSGFSAQVVKDGLVDAFRAAGRTPPELAPVEEAEHHIQVSVGRDTYLLLDLAHGSLHRRGYRQEGGAAPLKENLAAALLYRVNWPGDFDALVDPLCGSGTILIEAALMAGDIAPGLCGRFLQPVDPGMTDADASRTLLEEAQERKQAGLSDALPMMKGSDRSPPAVMLARENARRAGLEQWLTFEVEDATRLQPPAGVNRGLIVTNPPYGERLGNDRATALLYQALGEHWKAAYGGWQVAFLSPDEGLSRCVGLAPDKRYKLHNGPLPVTLDVCHVRSARERAAVAHRPAPTLESLTEGAQMLANRLKKNHRKLKAWLAREQIQAWRLYDADMPEYSAAIDCYGDHWLISEYAPPASVREEDARRRLKEVRQAVQAVFGVASDHLHLRQRRQQKGSSQYERLQKRGAEFAVEEYGARLLVNLDDYLDTGLFLDHRPMRQRIQKEAAGKRFLNLFCYTGSVTVHAGVGGATDSVSVDLSQTYLHWATRNFALNSLDANRHRVERADVLEWLQKETRQFDLIFMDPPTFSNSKRMEGVLDVQRDHVRLIDDAMARLASGGVLYFSNNFRRFQLDEGLSERYQVEDITMSTLPPDFQTGPAARGRPVHQCWRICPK